MPYQYWDIRPLDVNHCKLTITAAITVLHIEIKDGMCKYLDNENDTELMHLNDVWLKPKKFIKVKRNNINVKNYQRKLP
ncbi:hypothetical protein A3Q56_00100 [Intoshia linei]|uniref:Uncharacterized protein n=1 Tax=Intoshia linei TaxID=1819745 RepID=A0A177BD19_9BILA|nr:hypothetical protein A3Q56_00100 [Intoshia linei]